MGAPPEEGTGRAGGPFRRPPPCPLAGHGLRDAPEVTALQVLAPAGLEAHGGNVLVSTKKKGEQGP